MSILLLEGSLCWSFKSWVKETFLFINKIFKWHFYAIQLFQNNLILNPYNISTVFKKKGKKNLYKLFMKHHLHERARFSVKM